MWIIGPAFAVLRRGGARLWQMRAAGAAGWSGVFFGPPFRVGLLYEQKKGQKGREQRAFVGPIALVRRKNRHCSGADALLPCGAHSGSQGRQSPEAMRSTLDGASTALCCGAGPVVRSACASLRRDYWQRAAGQTRPLPSSLSFRFRFATARRAFHCPFAGAGKMAPKSHFFRRRGGGLSTRAGR